MGSTFMKSMKTIRELAREIEGGRISPVKLTEEVLHRIETLNPRINSYITILKEVALRDARLAERSIREGKYVGPLHGIPVAVKDLIYIKGVRCTAGSRILANYIATYDSNVTKKLRAGGAIIIGTTNLHEFASGVTNVNPFYGPVRNPWELGRVSGGSSGGSAAAVSAGMAVGAVGTDTSGSVRIPAALCGVVGLKPTYGRISRLGVVPLSTSLDTVGTLTSCVWDAALMLGALAGRFGNDNTSEDVEVQNYLADIEKPFRKVRAGIIRRYFLDGLDPAVREQFERFIDNLRKIGFTTSEIVIGEMDKVYDTWAAIRRSEAAAFHEPWFKKTPEKYGEDVRRGLDKGRQILAVDYIGALNRQPEIKNHFLEAMRNVDFLVVPTTPITAPLIGEEEVVLRGKKVEVYSALSKLTLPFNVIGFPVLSIPIGLAGGLPVGAQLVTRPFEESSLLRVAESYERRFGMRSEPLLPLSKLK